MSPPSVTGPGLLWPQPFEEVLGFGPHGPGTQAELQQVLDAGRHSFL